MHWVLQDNIYNEDGYATLLETLGRFGIPYSVHKVVPFVGDIDPDVNPPGKVVCMGSYSFRHLARQKGWSPGVWDIADEDFLVQRSWWGEHMLNYDSDVMEFEIAVFPNDLEQAFIRPVDDTKSFAGKVFDRDEFCEWQRRVCALHLDDGSPLTSDTLIQLCRPKTIWSEYRFWIVKGETVTSSLYKMGSRVRYAAGAPDYIAEFVKDRVAEWQPHDAFVIDAADTPNGVKIVEINTINASGFYAADIQKLVMSLENAFGEEPLDTDAQKEYTDRHD